MSNYNTGNPVPSTDPRDLDDNATNFDELLNSTEASVPDRLGVPRKTWHQMEIDAEALVSPNVAALAGLTGAADRIPYFTGLGALSLAVFTTVARTLNAATTQAAQRTALGLGSSATLAAGSANGVATLGADGLLPVSQLPPLAINQTFTVASQAAMLALTAERGDVAIRSDLAAAAYLLTADAPATLANWVPIQQNLGVALTALSAVTPAANKLAYFSGTATAALADLTAFARTLLDDADALDAGVTLGASAVGTNTTQLAQSAMIQNEIANKRAWTSFATVLTAQSGTFTSASATMKYMVAFGICHIQAVVTITTKGTGSVPVLTLPFIPLGTNPMPIPARENAVNGRSGYMSVFPGGNGSIVAYDNTDLITGNGCIVYVNGSYPIA